MVSRVYLVPGFFGFANFGDLKYFHHVEEALHEAFCRRGRNIQVIRVDTLPAASLARRAARLREIIVETAGGDADPIHVIGHSTGALDARLLVQPDRARDTDEAMVARVRSVVSVAGAHQGTPLASVFKSAFGKDLLKVLGTMTIHTLRLGPLSVGTAVRLAALLAAFDTAVGAKKDLIDQIEEQILADFSADRRAVLEAFFSEMVADQTLLDELTPEVCRHFDAHTTDRDGVRYGCVVTSAPAPGISSTLHAGLSPVAQASHAIYHALYRINAGAAFAEIPVAAVDAHRQLTAQLGAMPVASDNDGAVPTLSQFHGQLIHAVRADHHDVIGHFDDAGHDPPHIDWLVSGSRFRRPQFLELWGEVAGFIDSAETLPSSSTA